MEIFLWQYNGKTVLFSGLQIPNGAKALKQKAIGTGTSKNQKKTVS
jgi:hypothetical protein